MGEHTVPAWSELFERAAKADVGLEEITVATEAIRSDE